MIETVIRRLEILTLIAVLGCAAACHRERAEPSIGVGYVSSNSINLRDRLGATQYTVATLKQGQRLEIIGRQHHWLHVRTTSKQEGWIEERHIVTQEIFDRFEKVRQAASALPSEGTAKARRDLNLHLDPDRKSPAYYTLKEDESCDVVKRAFSERPPRPKQPPDKKEYEDWFLVRNPTAVGWGLAGNLDMAVPDDVLQYAEGKRVVAWFILASGPGEGEEAKPTILWATTSAMGLPHDFETVRVFSWGSRKKHYETSYIESNLRGYYPMEVTKDPPGFSYFAENKAGERVQYRFELQGNRVKRVSAPQTLARGKKALEHGKTRKNTHGKR